SIEVTGTLNIDLASLSSFDHLDITGAISSVTFDPGSEIHFILDGGFTPSAGNTFGFLSAAGGINGFGNLTYSFTGLGSGLSYQVLDLNNDSLQLNITGSAAPVPLPSSGGLFWSGLLGLTGFGWLRRRRRA
ncbi:MAG: hypothetical protein ACYC18_10440, partial [Gammaproteobacteria bacterium]